MPSRIDKSFLGEAAQRIYSLLDVSGEVSPKFTEDQKVVPVVVLGDGDRPGMGSRRGRRFAIGFIGGGGLSVDLVVPATATQPVEIDTVILACDTAGRITLRHLSAADVAGIGATLPDGRFLDANTTEEASPMQRTTGGAGGADIAYVRVAANGTVVLDFPFQLMPGCGLQAIGTGAGTTDFSVLGRTF